MTRDELFDLRRDIKNELGARLKPAFGNAPREGYILNRALVALDEYDDLLAEMSLAGSRQGS